MLSALFHWNATDFIAVFAGLLLVAGYLLWKQLRVTTRAIVKISEVSDNGPALHWTGDGPFYVTVQIKNFGKTPARVTDVFLDCRVLPRGTMMPNDVRTEKAAEAMVVLAPDEAFQRTFYLDISPAERKCVYAKTSVLFVYGYVDYVDRFGERRRGGYGRRYNPDVTPDNLELPEQAGLNFDVKRRRDQGVNWHHRPK